MATRSTNTAEEILQGVLADLGMAKSAPDGMQWLPVIVKVETTLLQGMQEGRQAQAQQQLQQNQAQMGQQGMQPMGPMGGGGMMPTGMGPPGMPGQPGPGVAGLRRTTPPNVNELQRLMTNHG